MTNRSPSSLFYTPTAAPRTRGRTRSRKGALAAAIEALEPRVLLTGTYTAALLSGSVNLFGMNKNGALTFNGNTASSAITAGSWNNQAGGPVTNVLTTSTYTVLSTGHVSATLVNDTVGTTTTLAGIMNGTRDVVALNETSAGTPVVNGLDVLVSTGGTYTTSLLAGTWSIAAQDFRGSITVNSVGVITGGTFYNEHNAATGNILGGSLTLNAGGSGLLSMTTSLAATSGYHTLALAFTMNAAKDTLVANNQALGNGTASAELAVLVKSTNTAAVTDIAGATGGPGITWTLNSALGNGSLTLHPGKTAAVTGSLTETSGAVDTITGTYVLGSNGTVIVNLNVTPNTTASSTTVHESFTGQINSHKNLIAMDRAISNGALASSLLLLTNPADHAPTERATATWQTSAYATSGIILSYSDLISNPVANVVDLDLDTIKLKVTPVNGTVQLIHGGVLSSATASEMQVGDSLLWTPTTTSGLIQAFTIQADDGTTLAANATKIFVNTGALPVISAVTTKANALSALAGSASSYGIIQLQAAGHVTSTASTYPVTIQIGGTAAEAVNYTLKMNGTTVPITTNGTVSTATIAFPTNKSSVILDVVPNLDATVTTNLTATVTVVADPNSTSPQYTPSTVHAKATVNELTSNPSIVIVPAVQKIVDGGTHELAFYVERTAPAGLKVVNSTNTVTITYSGTQNNYTGSHNVANDLTPGTVNNLTTVTFAAGQVKKIIYLSPGEDGVAATEQITATISDGSTSSFFAIPSASATVKVTDDAPTVKVKTVFATASEASPTTSFGEFQIIRTGSTASALIVDIAASGTAVQGTSGNYTLVSAANTSQTLTTTVTIPAGASSVNVELRPIDDGINEAAPLKAIVTLTPDATPSYHVAAANKSTISIINNNRLPTVGHTTATASTTTGTAVLYTFSALTSATGDALAAGSNGTLEFQLGKVFAGKLQIENGTSGTFTAVTAHQIFTAGETLKWTPPTGLHGTTAQAFSLFAVDNKVDSLGSTLFTVTIA